MRYFILLLVILISLNSAYAGLFSNNYDKHTDYSYQKLKNDIVKLEKRIFKQTFDYDTQDNRIERLERKIFGACQNGTTEERIMLLKNASQNYKAYNDINPKRRQYQPPIFTGSTGSNWRNILMGNFMNQFAGTATGFTPTLTPAMDPAMMDYFEADRAMSGYGNRHDYADNHRRYYNGTDTSSGAKVHILD